MSSDDRLGMRRCADIVKYRRQWDGWYCVKAVSDDNAKDVAKRWVKEEPLSEKTWALRMARANSGYGADLPLIQFRPWGDYLRQHPDARKPPAEFNLPIWAIRCLSGRTRHAQHPNEEMALIGTIVEEDVGQYDSDAGEELPSAERGRPVEVVTSGVRSKSAPPHYRRPLDVRPPNAGYHRRPLFSPEAASDASRSVSDGGKELADISAKFVLRCPAGLINPHPAHFLTKRFFDSWEPNEAEPVHAMGEWLKGVTVPAFDGDIGFTFAICRVASSQDMSHA